MKHLTKYIPLMAMLLASCTTPTASSSNEVPSSFEEASSSLVPSTSLTPLEADKKAINDYASLLKEIDGHAKSATVTVETHDYYPLEMVTVDEFTATVYKRDNGKSNILVRSGTITINGNTKDKTTYEMQVFAQDGSIYQLTQTSGELPKQNFVEDTPAGRDIELTLSFANKQADNLSFLSRVMDLEGVGYGIDFGDIPNGDGKFEFGYSMTSFVVENGVVTTTKEEEITHELEVTKQNGVIASYDYAYQLDMYYGGVIANSKQSFTSATLEQGEYATFEGEVWDPADFRTA